MNYKKLFFSLCLQIALQISGYSQTYIETRMKEVTGLLISGLHHCDTTKVLELFDVSASHIDQKKHRTFVKESILNDCKWYNKITEKYGSPDLNKLSFKKDPNTNANIAVLPLLEIKDSVLNLKSSTLFVEFYPDRFFNGGILSFSVSKEILIYHTIQAPVIKQR